MSSALSNLRKPSASIKQPVPVARSLSFGQKTSKPPAIEEEELEVVIPDQQRDANSLTIVENLQPGTKDFGLDPEGEEEWRHLEPNTGIRLSYVPLHPGY